MFDDVVGAMGRDAVGALEVRSTQPLTLVGRIYNQADDGTFGQSVAARCAEGGAWPRRRSAWLLGLRQVDGQYRTNLSVTNVGRSRRRSPSPSSTPTAPSCTYTLSRARAGRAGPRADRRRAGQPDLGWGFARVAVVAGSGILASASVIDSSTNDATTIPMQLPGCGAELIRWLEIATRGAGAFGSEWRTLVAARNTGDEDAVVTFVLHTEDGEHERTETVAAGAQLVVDDLVGALGLETKGSVEVRTSQPLDVVGRIYNQAADGTFGQFLGAAPAVAGLGFGDSAWLLGLRQQTDLYRTNLSVTNTGSSPAVVEVRLRHLRGHRAAHLSPRARPVRGRAGPRAVPPARRAARPRLGLRPVEGGDLGQRHPDLGLGRRLTHQRRDHHHDEARPERAACPPGPADLVLVAATAAGELTAAWTPAVDDTTPPAEMTYHVHLGSEADFQPGPGTLAATVVGDVEVVLRGLDPATEYYLLVLAEDRDGNLSRPDRPWAATTLEFMPVQRPGAVVQTAEALGLGEATADGAALVFQKHAGASLPTVGAVLIGPLAGGGGYLRTVVSVSQTTTEIRVDYRRGRGRGRLRAVPAALLGRGARRRRRRQGLGREVGRRGGRAAAQHEGGVRDAGGRQPGGPHRVAGAPGHGRDRAPRRPGRRPQVPPDRRAGRRRGPRQDPGPGGDHSRGGGRIDPELVTDATWTLTGVQTAEVVARGELDLHALARYEWTAAASYQQTVPIFTTSWLAVYSVGPVPVYQKITLSLEAELTASASAAITAEAAVAASAVVEVGARYTRATVAAGFEPRLLALAGGRPQRGRRGRGRDPPGTAV